MLKNMLRQSFCATSTGCYSTNKDENGQLRKTCAIEKIEIVKSFRGTLGESFEVSQGP